MRIEVAGPSFHPFYLTSGVTTLGFIFCLGRGFSYESFSIVVIILLLLFILICLFYFISVLATVRGYGSTHPVIGENAGTHRCV